MTDIFLSAGTSWTIPSDCQVINFIRAYGGGASGAIGGDRFSGAGGAGGGGGGFSEGGYNLSVTPGNAATISIGVAGTNDTSFIYGGSTVVLAKSASSTTGGQASAGIGSILFSGGNAGAGAASSGAFGAGGGGGGGAAGPNGNGGIGGTGGAPTFSAGGPGGTPGSANGAQAGQGGFGGVGGANTASTFGSPGGNGGAWGAGGGGGGGAGLQSGVNGGPGAGGLGNSGGLWINYSPNVQWSDSASANPSSSLRATAGLNLQIRSGLSIAATAAGSFSSPQQFISAKLVPASGLGITFTGQPRSITATLSPQANLSAYTAASKFLSIVLSAQASASARLAQKQNFKIVLSGGPVLTPFLSQKFAKSLAAVLSAEAIIPPPYANIPELFRKHLSVGANLSSDIMPVQFIGATLSAETGVSPDATLVSLQWITYGSEVLYAAASPLEKAMIDADAPRILQTDAEAIVDTWDPYNCPMLLLPYLAWAMGVTFWNDNWSEETKRTWIASQWQFKAFRGTDAAITMAVDFAGRDVSPYGYHVRDIITAPQGQYPSPGISHAAQEQWLSTLPQVRVYLFNKDGQAYQEEFYINYSFPGTELFITPNTATSRLGKQAVWNVHGQDVSNVGVLDFGNYFQLQMPGQAYPEEFYGDEAWPQYSYFTPSDAWKRLVTISPLTEAPYRIAVGPSYQAVEAQPELTTVPGLAGYDVFCGSNLYPYDGAGVFMAPDYQIPNIGTQLRGPQTLPVFPSFLLPSTSDYRIFYRYAVYDPDDLPTGGTQGTMFCGVGWFDYPPFTAEIDIFMASQRSPAEFTTYDFTLPSGRYTLPQDNTSLAYVAGAVEAARGLTSLTLLQPKPTPLFSAGAPFICGVDHYIVGQSQLSV